MNRVVELAPFHCLVKPNALFDEFVSVLIDDKELVKVYLSHSDLAIGNQSLVLLIDECYFKH